MRPVLLSEWKVYIEIQIQLGSQSSLSISRRPNQFPITMRFIYFTLTCVLPPLATAAGSCGAPQCDESTGYLCGVCDQSDPQICTVGGVDHPCKENSIGQGGGVSSSMLSFMCLNVANFEQSCLTGVSRDAHAQPNHRVCKKISDFGIHAVLLSEPRRFPSLPIRRGLETRATFESCSDSNILPVLLE